MTEVATPTTRNVSLDEETIQAVEALNERLRLKNFSAALRIIVQEWASTKVQPTPEKTSKKK